MRELTSLDAKIREWRARMAAGGIKSPAVLDELESHLREEIERQVGLAGDELKAFQIAAEKIGSSELLKAEFAKIRRFREIPLGKVMGIGCCVAAALYSMALAPPLVTVSELSPFQRFLGLASLSLTLLFLAGLRSGYKYLPVIRSRRARVVSVGACAFAGFFWLVIFSNLLPDVIVPRLMSQRTYHTYAVRDAARVGGGFPNSLVTRNSVSDAENSQMRQPAFVASREDLRPVFDIGLSLFWAMTLGAGLGCLACGLEEAAKRRSTELAYV